MYLGYEPESVHVSYPSFVFTLILIWFVLAHLFWCRYLGGEPISFLTISETVLPYRTLYRDFIDLNSPITYAYHAPAVWISQKTTLTPQVILRAYTLALVVFFLILYRRLLQRIWEKDRFMAEIILIAVSAKFLLPDWSFAQREYLLSLSIWLYVFVFLANSTSGRQSGALLSFVSGMLTGISVHMKLFFVCIPLNLLVIESIRRRTLDAFRGTQSVGFFTGFLACGTISFFLYPAYFTDVLPLAIKTYPYYNAAFDIRTVPESYALLWLIVLLSLFRAKQRYMFFILVWVGVLSFLIAAIQNKGFSYHFFPANLSLLIGLITGTYLWKKETFQKSFRNTIVLSFIIFTIFLVCFALPFHRALTFGPIVEKRLRESAGAFNRNQCVTYAALGTTVYRQNNLASYACVRHDFVYPNFWMLPGFYKNHTGIRFEDTDYHDYQKMEKDEKLFFDSVISDLQKTNPDYVLIDVAEQKAGFSSGGFDYKKYFSQDDRFIRFISQYAFTGKTADFDMYKKAR